MLVLHDDVLSVGDLQVSTDIVLFDLKDWTGESCSDKELTQDIQITNTGRVPRSLRVTNARDGICDPNLCLSQERPWSTLAPGMTVRLQAICRPQKTWTKNTSVRSTNVVIAAETEAATVETMQVRISALLWNRIAVSVPDALDFGLVSKRNQQKEYRQLTVQNTGNVPISLEVKPSETAAETAPSFFTVSPLKQCLQSGEEVTLTVELSEDIHEEEQIGELLQLFELSFKGEADVEQTTSRVLPVSATIVAQRLFTTFRKTPTDIVQFKRTRVNDQREVTVQLVNDSPTDLTFQASLRRIKQDAKESQVGDDRSSSSAEDGSQDADSEDIDEDINIIPFEGKISAFQSTAVRICFKPRPRPFPRGFKHQLPDSGGFSTQFSAIAHFSTEDAGGNAGSSTQLRIFGESWQSLLPDRKIPRVVLPKKSLPWKRKGWGESTKAHGRMKGKSMEEIQDDADLHLEYLEGRESLLTARIELPESPAALWRAKSTSEQFTARDESIEHKVYPEQPMTSAECHDCSLQLRSQQLRQIKFGPRTIEFGQLTVGSRQNVRYFRVHNPLEGSIHIEVLWEEGELSSGENPLQKSCPRAQVIPPGGTASFDVDIFASEPCDHEKKIHFVVNKHHRRSFSVLARVVPATLSCATDELSFDFSPQSPEFVCCRKLRISNPGNAVASFSAIVDDGVGGCVAKMFTVSPSNGKLKAGETAYMMVTFEPRHGFTENEESSEDSKTSSTAGGAEHAKVAAASGLNLQLLEACLRFQVENGLDTAVRLISSTKNVKSTLEVVSPTEPSHARTTSLGDFAVGTEGRASFDLKNACAWPVAFKISLPENSALNISQASGVVPSEANHGPITVICKPDRARAIDEEIQIKVRGGPTLTHRIVGRAVVPNVSLLAAESDGAHVRKEEISFGHVVIGDQAEKRIALRNDGNVAALLYLDLQAWPEFTLKYDSELSDVARFGNPDECPVTEISRSVDSSDLRTRRDSLSQSSDSIGSGKPLSSAGSDASDGEIYYRFFLKPRSEIVLTLCYRPLEERRVCFELPLVLSGVPAKSSLLTKLRAVGERARILLSHSAVNFRSVVVNTSPNFSGYEKEFALQSNEDLPLRWRIDGLADDSVFALDASEGVLQPGEEKVVTVTFNPKESRAFGETLGLKLQNHEENYLLLHLQGEAYFPYLLVDRMAVQFEAVPLGVRASQVALLRNCGYDSVDVKAMIPNVNITDGQGKSLSVPVPIEVSFPDGSHMGRALKSIIPVEISFVSARPLCISTEVSFVDNFGKSCRLPVTAVADNCVLTVQQWLCQYDTQIQESYGHEGALVVTKLREVEQDQVGEEPVSEFGGMSWLGSSSIASSASSGTFSGFQKPAPPPLLPPRIPSMLLRFGHASGLVPALNASSATEQKHSRVVKQGIQDLVQSGGWGIVALLLSERVRLNKDVIKRPAALARCAASVEMKDGLRMYRHYAGIVTALKACGSAIAVQPEHLMSLPQSVQVQLKDLTDGNVTLSQRALHRRRRALAKVHSAFLVHSWTALLMQVVKVFALDRVSTSTLQAVAKESPPTFHDLGQSVTDSNVYSLGEHVLLRWLQYCYEKHKLPSWPDAKIVDFASIRPQVWSCAIKEYAPWQQVDMENFDCENADDLKNAENLLEQMHDLNINDMSLTAEELAAPLASTSLLFTLFLLEKLPDLVPCSTFTFKSLLHETSAKEIELSNESTVPLRYSITFVPLSKGMLPFSFDDGTTNSKKIDLKPQSSSAIQIRCCPRFFNPVPALVIVQPVVNSSSSSELLQQAAAGELRPVRTRTLVFELRCVIEGAQPLTQLDAKCQLYDRKDIVLKVPEGVLLGRQGVHSFELQLKNEDDRLGFPAPFRLKQKPTLRIEAGGPAEVLLELVPLKPEICTAELWLQNPSIGAFMVSLQGEPEMPEAVGTITAKVQHGEDLTVIVPVRPHNVTLDIHRALSVDDMPRKDRAAALEKLRQPLPQDDIECVCSSPFFECALQPYDPDAVSSENSTVNDFVAVPARLRSVVGVDDSPPTRQFCLKLRQHAPPGRFTGQVVLMSRVDIRVYEIDIVVVPRGSSSLLRMETPCRKVVEQHIPIWNGSDTEWKLLATLTQPSSSGVFSGPSELIVPPQSSAEYTLQFSPTWVGEEKAELVLSRGEEQYAFELHGIALEPMAQQSVEIQCRVRETSKAVLKVTVPDDMFEPGSREVTLNVETAGCSFIGGARQLQGFKSATGPNVAKYEIIVTPHASGTFNGALSFVAPHNGHFFWISLAFRAERAASEGTLMLEAEHRQAQVARIQLENPTSQSQQLKCTIDGRGLLGAAAVNLGPNESIEYELTFAPLKVGSWRGQIVFSNDELGDFWFDCECSCTPAKPLVIPTMDVPIGSRLFLINAVTLTNPSEKDTVVKVAPNRQKQIRVAAPSQSLKLPAFSTVSVPIEYAPTMYNIEVRNKIHLRSDSIGAWEVRCSLKGGRPSDAQFGRPLLAHEFLDLRSNFKRTMVESLEGEFYEVGDYVAFVSCPTKKVALMSALNERQSHLLHFVSPFAQSVHINVSLISKDLTIQKTRGPSGHVVAITANDKVGNPIFKLVSRRLDSVPLLPNGSLDLPLLFVPAQMAAYRAQVVVSLDPRSSEFVGAEDFSWTYDLEGISEMRHEEAIVVKCHCRDSLHKKIHLDLPGLFEATKEAEELDGPARHLQFSLETHSEAVQQAMELGWLTVVPENKSLLTSSESSFDLRFEPLKSFIGDHELDLVVKAPTDARWTFPIKFHVAPAKVDSSLRIEAPIGETKSMRFVLCNHEDSEANFRAFITRNSPNCFAVHPTSGVLPPVTVNADGSIDASQGTEFVVSFESTEYVGEPLFGELVVETECFEWRFELVEPSLCTDPSISALYPHTLGCADARSSDCRSRNRRNSSYAAAISFNPTSMHSRREMQSTI